MLRLHQETKRQKAYLHGLHNLGFVLKLWLLDLWIKPLKYIFTIQEVVKNYISGQGICMFFSSSVIEWGLIFCAKPWNVLCCYRPQFNFCLLFDLGEMNNDSPPELLLLPVSHSTSFLRCLEHLLLSFLLRACSYSHSQLIICLPTCTEHCLEKGPCLINLCMASA